RPEEGGSAKLFIVRDSPDCLLKLSSRRHWLNHCTTLVTLSRCAPAQEADEEADAVPSRRARPRTIEDFDSYLGCFFLRKRRHGFKISLTPRPPWALSREASRYRSYERLRALQAARTK